MDEDRTEFRPSNFDDWTLNHLSTYLEHGVTFMRSVFYCSKPVIAMIDGYCLAGGLDVAMLCDVRYCSDVSRFGAIEARIGLGDTELPIMSHVIGQRCRELVYTGDMFDAHEAYRLGLVNRIFTKDRLEEEVTHIAKRMSRVALPALRWSKRALNNTLIAAGLESAFRYSFTTDLIIGRSDSELKKFRELARTLGAKAAFEWRDSIFGPFELETSRVSSRSTPKSPSDNKGSGVRGLEPILTQTCDVQECARPTEARAFHLRSRGALRLGQGSLRTGATALKRMPCGLRATGQLRHRLSCRKYSPRWGASRLDHPIRRARGQYTDFASAVGERLCLTMDPTSLASYCLQIARDHRDQRPSPYENARHKTSQLPDSAQNLG
ncbi:hypothetical protein ACM41_12370 [Bradyrhizobium sp. CCBAU 21362]|nr:hypothetical protein [Bradyrhizobium sp. CCBAU 21362]